MNLSIKPLNESTWADFEALAQAHNGVWGGCWCTWFHHRDKANRGSAELTKAYKKKLVMEGNAHAALVYDGEKAIAWCQYGSPQELPSIYHKKEVETDGYIQPDWRITCIFVDSKYRKHGVSKLALEGALALIEEAGGGTVESYPQDTQNQKISSSFLYNGTRSIFEECGFEYIGPKGKNHTIMRKIVAR